MDVQESVRRQFGPVAAAYATSSVHTGGPDLAAMLEAGSLRGDELVLDVAAGAGHTALAFAQRVASVVAVDLTAAMLATGLRLAEENGIDNATFVQADAEHLPFPDDAFDLVTCRYAAHHFPRPAAAAREWARVLKPSGRLLLVDVVSPDDPTTDTVLNAAEVLRDPSHVRDHTVAQWFAMLAGAGFTVEEVGNFRYGSSSPHGPSGCGRRSRPWRRSGRFLPARRNPCETFCRSRRTAPSPVRWCCCGAGWGDG